MTDSLPTLVRLSLGILGLASTVLAGDDPASLLQQGQRKEESNKDLYGAIELYSQVVKRAVEAPEAAAEAQFRIGACLMKQRLPEEAIAEWQKVIERYAGQKAWVDRAKERIAAQEPEDDESSRDVRKRMAELRITLNFDDAPLSDAVLFLQEYSRLNLLVDQSAVNLDRQRVTLKVDDIAFEEAFDRILDGLGLEYQLDGGVIIISTAAAIAVRRDAATQRSAQAASEDKEIREKLDVTKIDLDFTDATIADIVMFLQEYGRIEMEFDAEVLQEGRDEVRFSLSLREVTLRTALRLALEQAGLTWVGEGRKLKIKRDDWAR